MSREENSRGSISKNSFRRLSLSVRDIDLVDRDSDDEISDEEGAGDAVLDTKDTIFNASDIPTSSQRSSFAERV